MIEAETRELFNFIKAVRGIQVWLDEGEDPEDPRWAEMDPFDILLERDHLMVGSPESVAERMIRFAEDHNVDHWLLSIHRAQGDEQAERTMRLLAEEVAPAVRRAAEASAAA